MFLENKREIFWNLSKFENVREVFYFNSLNFINRMLVFNRARKFK